MTDLTVTEAGSQDETTEEVPETDGFSFPRALTVLVAILALVWLASFFIPSGRYEQDASGAPVPGSYERLEQCRGDEVNIAEGGACVDKSVQGMFSILWTSLTSGLYGVEQPGTGFVGPSESGLLFGAAQIFFFVLAIGSFITITMDTGAIDAGLGRLALRYRHSPTLLVVVIMAVFGLGGSTFGLWSETLGFIPLLVPLAVALGYDRMVGVGIAILGAGSGVVASTVNPFSTGIASDAAGVSITDGILPRLVLLIVLVGSAIAYVLWYGNRVRADASRSLVISEGGEEVAALDIDDIPDLTGTRTAILAVFGLAFVIMIYGFIPWDQVWPDVFDAEYPLPTMVDLLGDFFFAEAAMLFIVAAVVIGVIARMGEADIVASILKGAADFLSAGLVIVAARAITVIMKNTFVTDTVLNVMETAVEDASAVGFGMLAWLANIPIAFLVPSSSGHAGLVMPILGPVSGFADVEASTSVTAYQSASGWVNLVTPTSTVVLSGLTLAKVRFDRYVRFVVPYLVLSFVLISIVISVTAGTS